VALKNLHLIHAIEDTKVDAPTREYFWWIFH